MDKIPNGWESTKLGDVLILNYGKSLPKKERDGGHYKVYGSNGSIGSHSEALVDNPCLIVGRKGSFGEVNLAKYPSWPIDTTYFIDEFHKQPISYWHRKLQHLPLTEMNRATAIPGLNREDAYSLEIGLPPINEQKRIADKLHVLLARSDNAKDALDAISALLDQYRQSILVAAFRGDLTKDWRGNIRKNWNISTVGSLINNIQSGKSFKCIERPPKANEKGIVKVSAVSWGSFNEEESKTVTDISRLSEKAKIYEGDLLFSRANTVELVGACLITTKFKKDLYLSDKILRLDVPEEYKIYLKWFLRSPSGRNQIEEMATGAQHSMKNISQSSLKKITMPFPPKEEMLAIGQALEKMGKFLDQISSKIIKNDLLLNILNRSILTKAFRGELVPQDPNDEPASELLKRIQIEREQLGKELKTKKNVTRNKPSGRNRKMIIPIVDALKQSENPLSSQQLLSAAGYPNNAGTDQIEQFFLDIRQAIDDMQVEMWREGDQDYFRLAG